jgi:hypothetical protein
MPVDTFIPTAAIAAAITALVGVGIKVVTSGNYAQAQQTQKDR